MNAVVKIKYEGFSRSDQVPNGRAITKNSNSLIQNEYSLPPHGSLFTSVKFITQGRWGRKVWSYFCLQ